MHYSLFIDESGDFEDKRKEWVVAGLLCACSAATAEHELEKILKTVAKKFDLQYPKDFHLTDLRRVYGNEKANKILAATIEALLKSPFDYSFLSVVNTAHRDASYRERTYRLMLLDLLAMVETAISSDEPLIKLDFVVASRTTANDELMTSESEIKQEILEQLPTTMEVGLAAKGLIHAFSSDNITLQLGSAHQQPGLIIADFVANLIFNRKYQDNTDTISRLTDLRGNGKLTIFEAFGGYEERKAKIAERDGDFVTALFRWAVLKPTSKQTEQTQNETISRLCHKIVTETGSYGPYASIEALIERFQRTSPNNKALNYKQLCEAIRKIELPLEAAISENKKNSLKLLPLIFRLRNYLLLNLNHLGDIGEADRVISLQEKNLAQMLLSPDNFGLVLDYQNLCVERYVNNLEFTEALKLAQQHLDLLEAYKVCWELFNEQTSSVSRSMDLSFEASRPNIRALSNLLRCKILGKPFSSVWDSSNKNSSESDNFKQLFNRLEVLPLSTSERKRLRSYQVMSLLKDAEYLLALQQGVIFLDEETNRDTSKVDPFDILWVAHAATDALLANRENEMSKRLSFEILKQLRRLNLDERKHPNEILWRERGMLEWLLEYNVKEAERCFGQSKQSIEIGLTLNAPITVWLQNLLLLHSEVIKNNNQNVPKFFAGKELPSSLLTTIKNIENSSNLPLFQPIPTKYRQLAIARTVSPY